MIEPAPDIATQYGEPEAFYLYLHRIRRRVERDSNPYTDSALAPIDSALLPARPKEKVLTGAAA